MTLRKLIASPFKALAKALDPSPSLLQVIDNAVAEMLPHWINIAHTTFVHAMQERAQFHNNVAFRGIQQELTKLKAKSLAEEGIPDPLPRYNESLAAFLERLGKYNTQGADLVWLWDSGTWQAYVIAADGSSRRVSLRVPLPTPPTPPAPSN